MVALYNAILALCALVGICLTSANAATESEKRKLMQPAIQAATACITASVASDPALPSPTTASTVSRIVERALNGSACAADLRRMIERHDQIYGEGTGLDFLQNAYTSDLPRAVMGQLNGTGPLVSGPKAVAASPASAKIDPTLGMQAPAASSASLRASEMGGDLATTSHRSLPVAMINAGSQYVSLFLIGAGFSMLVLLIIGFGSRFVVFADDGDLLMTSCIFIVPVATAAALSGVWFLISAPSPTPRMDSWEFAQAFPAMAITLAIGVLVWLWAVVGTLTSSICQNGLIVGILIACMKLMAGVFMVLAWFGSLHLAEGFSDGRESSTSFLRLLFLGILIWLAAKLINGERVFERREYRARMRLAPG